MWKAARVSEPCLELVCLFPARLSLPVAMEVRKTLSVHNLLVIASNHNILFRKELKQWIYMGILLLALLGCFQLGQLT